VYISVNSCDFLKPPSLFYQTEKLFSTIHKLGTANEFMFGRYKCPQILQFQQDYLNAMARKQAINGRGNNYFPLENNGVRS